MAEIVELKRLTLYEEQEHGATSGDVLGVLHAIERGEVSAERMDPQWYGGNTWFRTSNGWELLVFDDADSWDYLDSFRTPAMVEHECAPTDLWRYGAWHELAMPSGSPGVWAHRVWAPLDLTDTHEWQALEAARLAGVETMLDPRWEQVRGYRPPYGVDHRAYGIPREPPASIGAVLLSPLDPRAYVDFMLDLARRFAAAAVGAEPDDDK